LVREWNALEHTREHEPKDTNVTYEPKEKILATEHYIALFAEIERRYPSMSVEDRAKFMELRKLFCREPDALRDGTGVLSANSI
jgi:hypothetical protein